MIGSHDTFTYLKSTNSLYNTVTQFWRTQTKTLAEQYEVGVRYFDVRIVFDKKMGNKNLWRAAHGDCKLNKLFLGIQSIINIFSALPGSVFRIVLEDSKDKDLFIEELNSISDKKGLVYAAIKNPWILIWEDKNARFNIQDFTYKPIDTGKSVWYNITHFKLSTIKSWAEKHNPVLSQQMIDDPINVYWIDYV